MAADGAYRRIARIATVEEISDGFSMVPSRTITEKLTRNEARLALSA
jgi:hypothetical protein